MIRTRDFLLFLIIIGFLIVIIGVGTFQKMFTQVEIVHAPTFSETTIGELTAEATVKSIDRPSRIAWFKEQLRDWVEPEPELVIEPAVSEESQDEETVTSDDDPVTASGVQQCANFLPYRGEWPRAALTIIEVEGSRVVTVNGGLVDESMVLVLPKRTFGGLAPSCLPTDVVAVAQTGALIRNNEAGGFAMFGETTLLGYTLDGFPLYGMSDQPTDRCGGAVVDGAYRYYLSAERIEVLNCFVAPPVTLP
jgi:hypothetical protein